MEAIKTTNLTKYYGKARGIVDLNLSVEQGEFFAMIRERNREGATVFLSSHVLSEIQQNCTRAAIIREGQMIACDSVEALSKTNARRVTVHGSATLDGLDGIQDRVDGNGCVSFLYSGDMNLLVMNLMIYGLSIVSMAAIGEDVPWRELNPTLQPGAV